jgi:hypothetical protein
MTDQITADQVIEQVDKYKQLSIGSKKAGRVLSKRHVQREGRDKTRAVQLGLAMAVVVIIEMIMNVLAPVGTASATPPQPVRIENLVDFSDPDGVTEFSATGGIICESGTAQSTPHARHFVFAGNSGRHERILVGKHMTCSDGTFELLVRVRLDLETFNTKGKWTVGKGTGAYAGLHGVGEIVGTRQDNGGFNAPILDVYTGKIHVN